LPSPTPDDQIVTLTARHAVAICIGSTAALPDLPGIAEARPWTNRRATDSSSVPARLAVVGGGGVAVEMATAWRGLGSDVTLLARRSGCCRGWSPSLGNLSGRVSQRQVWTCGRCPRSPSCAGRVAPDRSTVSLDDGTELEVDEVLFAKEAEQAGHRTRVVDVEIGEVVPGRSSTPTGTPAGPGWS
jgi:dihydrolipoamide dehydrogenase